MLLIDRERLNSLVATLSPQIAESIKSVLEMIDDLNHPDDEMRAVLAELMQASEHLRGLLIDGQFPQLPPSPPITIGLIESPADNVVLPLGDVDVLCVLGDDGFDGDLKIDTHQMLIVKGNLRARNIIVYGHLFVDGDLDCRVIFGASSNDNMTHVSGSIRAQTIAENGHFTRAERSISVENFIAMHNEISAPELLVSKLHCARGENPAQRLNVEMLGDDGYFDEEKFLALICREDYCIARDGALRD